MRVLLVGPPDALPSGVDGWLARHDWNVATAPDVAAAARAVRSDEVDAVVLPAPTAATAESAEFFRIADARRITTLVVGDGDDRLPASGGSFIDRTPANVSKEEISWRLATLSRFQVHVKRMELELEHMQRLGQRLNEHFREIDDEMRLASRLQRDFLPRDVDRIGPLRFATIYRPASWVSGDIFDIERVDERHVAFYVADAVGHGMSAGLLTMFIKRSIMTKRVTDSAYEIIAPGDALCHLNDALAAQALPHCQFVTGVYCLIDTESLSMTYARGGHPYPILASADGGCTELMSAGGLMGLFPGMDCATQTVQLHPGDKIILYTDGVETALEHVSPDPLGRRMCFDRGPLPEKVNGSGVAATTVAPFNHEVVLASLSHRRAADLIARLTDMLDNRRGSLQPDDDVTVVVMEVAPAD